MASNLRAGDRDLTLELILSTGCKHPLIGIAQIAMRNEIENDELALKAYANLLDRTNAKLKSIEVKSETDTRTPITIIMPQEPSVPALTEVGEAHPFDTVAADTVAGDTVAGDTVNKHVDEDSLQALFNGNIEQAEYPTYVAPKRKPSFDDILEVQYDDDDDDDDNIIRMFNRQ